MSLQIVPMVAGEEKPDDLVQRGSEIAAGLHSLSDGLLAALWCAPLMPDKLGYSNA
jgi:hypothetical protein